MLMADLPETSGLNLVELLDLLRPIPEPEPISMVPATQGWLWLVLAIGTVTVWIVGIALRRRRSSAYRRAALAELDQAGGDPARVAAILRRTALVAYPRRQVAALVGDDWLRFLDGTCAGSSFADGPGGQLLTKAPYSGFGQVDTALLHQCRHWIEKHREGKEQ